MEIFFAWIIFSIVVAIVASARGRSGIGYFFLSVLLSPLIGIILVALLPSLKDAPTAGTHARCPMCAEVVLREARKCKHCGHEFAKTAGEDADVRRVAQAAPPKPPEGELVEIHVPWQTAAGRGVDRNTAEVAALGELSKSHRLWVRLVAVFAFLGFLIWLAHRSVA